MTVVSFVKSDRRRDEALAHLDHPARNRMRPPPSVVLKPQPQEPSQLHSVGDGATVRKSCRWTRGRAAPDACLPDKDQPRDEDTEGGSQSADKSLIDRSSQCLHLRPVQHKPSLSQKAPTPPLLGQVMVAASSERLGPPPDCYASSYWRQSLGYG